MPEHLRLQNMEVYEINKFRSNPSVNTSFDMIRVTIDMPISLWRKVCHYLGVDYRGNKLKEK